MWTCNGFADLSYFYFYPNSYMSFGAFIHTEAFITPCSNTETQVLPFTKATVCGNWNWLNLHQNGNWRNQKRQLYEPYQIEANRTLRDQREIDRNPAFWAIVDFRRIHWVVPRISHPELSRKGRHVPRLLSASARMYLQVSYARYGTSIIFSTYA